MLADRLAGLPTAVQVGDTGLLNAAGIPLAEYDAMGGVTWLLGDVQDTPHLRTDATGTVTGTTERDPLGPVTAVTGEQGLVGYTGEVEDVDTGLTYLRARWLDPTLGRMLSADSVQPNAPSLQGYNLYAYVGG